MAAGEASRKLLCDCGKQLGTFTREGLDLYCRFSKETTTVPYRISNLQDAVAFEERRRRERHPPDRGGVTGRGRRRDGTVRKSGR